MTGEIYILKDNGKLILRAVSRYGNHPDYLQTNIERMYSRDYKTKHFVQNNSNKSEFFLLEDISRQITKRYREEITNSKDNDVIILVFCYFGRLYCIQTDFKTYGSDLYTLSFIENDKWNIFTTDEVNIMLGLRDRFAIQLNVDFLNKCAIAL